MRVGTEHQRHTGRDTGRRSGRWWLGVGIVLVAANLRPAVVAVSPILEEIRAAESLSATAAGVLTALPVLCFGALAPLAPRLTLRFGPERTLLLAMVALLAGFALRLVPGLVPLYAGTVVAGGAIAIGNVLLPSLIKRDFAERAGLMTGLYTMAISAGGALGAGLTVPVARAAGLDWRGALGMWGLFAGLALLAWAPHGLVRGTRPAGPVPARGGLLRDGLAWQVTGFMGLQSLAYYATMSWLPAVFVSRGTDPATAGWMLSLASAAGIAGSLAAPMWAARLRTQVVPVLVVTGLLAVGLLGVWLLPSAAWASMAVLGVGQGAALGLALTLIVLRAADGPRAAELSGMAQSIGYCLAAAGPFLFGALHDASGGWAAPMLLLLALFVPQALCGVGAGRDRHVRPAPATAAE